MPQHLFARPRTPKDNPFAESLFGNVKTAPDYLGRFLDRDEGVDFFSRFFPHYNTVHLRLSIWYAIPQQWHRKLREQVVFGWKARLIMTERLLRKGVNCLRQRWLTNDLITLIGNHTTPKYCSIINR